MLFLILILVPMPQSHLLYFYLNFGGETFGRWCWRSSHWFEHVGKCSTTELFLYPQRLLSLTVFPGFHPGFHPPKLSLDLHSTLLFFCTSCKLHASPLDRRFLKERNCFILSLPAQCVAYPKSCICEAGWMFSGNMDGGWNLVHLCIGYLCWSDQIFTESDRR